MAEKMKKWTKKEVKELVTSPEFKKSMEEMNQRMEEFEKDQREQFDAEEWLRILFTPMGYERS